MSEVVEGQEDSITSTRRALFAGNTIDTMRPVDVAEAAYYQQHPDEKPGAESSQPDAAAQPSVDAQTETSGALHTERDPLDDIEVTPENANLISAFVTRPEFNRLLDRLNTLEIQNEELVGRIERFNKTAPHKIA